MKNISQLSLEEITTLAERVFEYFDLACTGQPQYSNWEELVEELFLELETMDMMRNSWTSEHEAIHYAGFLEDINCMAVTTVQHVVAKILWLSTVVEYRETHRESKRDRDIANHDPYTDRY